MLFSLFYTFVYYLWVCTYICVHTGCASQSVQENNCAIFSHFASEWTQAAKLARQTQLPAESPHLTCTVFLLSENIITKREIKLNLIHFTIFDI